MESMVLGLGRGLPYSAEGHGIGPDAGIAGFESRYRGERMKTDYGYEQGHIAGKEARCIWDSNDERSLKLHAQIALDRTSFDSVQDDYAIGYRDGWRETYLSE